jgi:hypothetical protein
VPEPPEIAALSTPALQRQAIVALAGGQGAAALRNYEHLRRRDPSDRAVAKLVLILRRGAR